MRIFLNTKSFFSRNKILITSILFFTLYSSALIAFATPPGSPFTPGEETDPTCGPTDPNCYVGGSALIGSTSTIGTETWLGEDAGVNSGSTDHTVFVGISAGDGATAAVYSNFIGNAAGTDATGAEYSNFIGVNAGSGATDAVNSNFIGVGAGTDATSVSYGNFFGDHAGDGATGANYANFIGTNAGQNASGATYGNFIGAFAGSGATSATESNFMGRQTGYDASSATYANFIGSYAGLTATNATSSNFFGYGSGITATNASRANFFGYNAGANATNAKNATFIGYQAGNSDTVNNTVSGWSILIGNNTNTGGFQNSVLLGGTNSGTISNTAANQFMLADTITKARWRGVEYTFPSAQAGGSGYVLSNNGSGTLSWAAGATSLIGATSSTGTETWLGSLAGSSSGSTDHTVFAGINAGHGATSATLSNFIGWAAGYNATSASSSNFFGSLAGDLATTASQSNFFGYAAGNTATHADSSNFIGYSSGDAATNAASSNFIGFQAGDGATNAAYSIFIGTGAGLSDDVNNTSGSTWSVLIGDYTSTGGFQNSVLLGGTSDPDNMVTNTASNQFMLADTITKARWRGVEYTFPSAQAGGSGYVLTNNGSGVLSWAAGGGGGGGSSQWTTTGSDIYYNDGNVGIGTLTPGSLVDAQQDSGDSFFRLGTGARGIDFKSNDWGSNGFLPIHMTMNSEEGFNLSQDVMSMGLNSNQFTITDNSGSASFVMYPGGNDVFLTNNASGVYFVSNVSTIGDVNQLDNGTRIIVSDTDDYINLIENSGLVIRGVNYNFPADNGSNGDVLTSDGSGNLSWLASGGGGGGGGVTIDSHVNMFAGSDYTFTSGEENAILGVDSDLATLALGSASRNVHIGNNNSDYGEWSDHAIGINDSVTIGANIHGAENSSVFIGSNTGGLGGYGNVAIGLEAGNHLTGGAKNVYIGYGTGRGPDELNGDDNVVIGSTLTTYGASFDGWDFSRAVFLGAGAGGANGNDNVCIGTAACNGSGSVTKSVGLGYNAQVSQSNSIALGGSGSDAVKVGIGTATPESYLHIFTATDNTTAETITLNLAAGSITTADTFLAFKNSGGLTGSVAGTGVSGTIAYNVTSDQRLKENIVDAPDALGILSNIHVRQYDWRATGSHVEYGFVAQELNDAYSEPVAIGGDDPTTNPWMIDYSRMTPILTKAIQELNIKLTNISDLTESDDSFVGRIRTWLADATNGITDLFANKVTTKELCLEDVCVTKAQLQQLLQNQNNGGGTNGGSTTTSGSTTGEETTTTGTTTGEESVTGGDTTTTTGSEEVGTTTGDEGTTTSGDTGIETPPEAPSDTPVPDSGN